MKLEYAKQAVKALNGMDKVTQQRIKKSLEALPAGDVKPLQGHIGSFRLRVGTWRILFSYIEYDIILIEKIAPRGNVYKGV